jgi:AcrR family transcriptional regulator
MSTDDGHRPAARGPYAKTPAVKQKIIQACLEVFSECGYRGTTMKAVAERAGISQRGLVHHFPSKEVLLAAVLESRDELAGQVSPNFGSARALVAAVNMHLENMQQRQTLLELHTVLSADAVSPEHPGHEYYADRYAHLRLYLSTAFDALREEGRVRSSADSATLAAMVIGLMDGLQVQWLYSPGSVDTEKAFNVFFDSIGVDLDEEVGSPVAPDTVSLDA